LILAKIKIMVTSQKKLIGLVIIGLMLIIAGAFFYSARTEKSNPKAVTKDFGATVKRPAAGSDNPASTTDALGWQTYRNEEYGFKINYPSGWTVHQNSNKDGIVSIGDSVSNSGFNIEELPNKNKLTFDKWFDQEVVFKNNTNYKSRRQVINGIDVEIFDTAYHAVSTHGIGGMEAYLADDQGRIIHIVAGGHGMEIENIFKYMLLTFEFVENVDNLGWYTYRNKEMGIEFQYPNDRAVVLSAQGDLVRFRTENEAAREKECQDNVSQMIEQGLSFGPSGCMYGVYVSILDNDDDLKDHDLPMEQLPTGNSLKVFELHRYYQAPEIAVAVQYPDSEGYVMFEGYGVSKKVIEQIIATLKFTKSSPEANSSIVQFLNNWDSGQPQAIPSTQSKILLEQMFPGLSLNGTDTRQVKIDKLIKGNFLGKNMESYLLIAKTGGSNPEGYLHAYLGIFDQEGVLRSPIVSKTKIPILIEANPPHFGDDRVDFKAYDCNGITYIFIGTKQCSTGGSTQCYDSNNLFYKINNGQFEVVQDLKDEFPGSTLAMAVDSGIRLYQYKQAGQLGSDFDQRCTDKNKCLEIAYVPGGVSYAVFNEEIPFNSKTCRFAR